MSIDFGKTAGDYAKYRARYPASLFERLAKRGIGGAGQRILDLGTGTGMLAIPFAERGGSVTALDPARAFLEEARRLAAASGASIDFVEGRAEETGLASNQFDVATAGTCWHWFDGPRAAVEVKRVVVPGGRLVLVHMSWVVYPNSVADATEELISRHNPQWPWRGSSAVDESPRWTRQLLAAGFLELETFSYQVAVPYTHEAWRGRIRASAGVGASLAPQEVTAFDDELSKMLLQRFPDQLQVPHSIFVLIGQVPR